MKEGFVTEGGRFAREGAVEELREESELCMSSAGMGRQRCVDGEFNGLPWEMGETQRGCNMRHLWENTVLRLGNLMLGLLYLLIGYRLTKCWICITFMMKLHIFLFDNCSYCCRSWVKLYVGYGL